MQKPRRFTSTILLSAALVAGALLAAASAQEENPAKTKRVYLMGSSLTDQVNYGGLQALAESRGYNHVWGRHMVPGAPIRWLWTHKDGGNSQRPFGTCGTALKDYAWDALTLEPRGGYEGELAAANELINFAVKKSPSLQVYIFAQWPRIGRGSFDKQWLAPEKDIQNNIRLGFEEFLTDVRKAHPDIKPPLMIPVGHAFHLLQLKIRAGLVPGMETIFDGYSDRSHQNYLGEYIVGCTFFATIYGETPVGLPTEPYGEIAPDLARTIQETVWEAVNAHPRSGVKAAGEFKVITPYLPDAIEGGAYDRELLSAFGKEPVSYALAGGALPPGMEVAAEGRITGASDRGGDYEFTVQATDADGRTARRKLRLTCAAESKPTIPEQDVPGMERGKYVDWRVKAEGGNGDISWRLAGSWMRDVVDGEEHWKALKRGGHSVMPPGLDLTYDGIVSGTPAEQGVYKVIMLAEDSDPTEPDTGEREFIFDVGAAGPDVYFVQPAPENPTLDGKLDEPFWKLDRAVKKPVIGKPSCTATFAVVWGAGNLSVAIKVQDDKVVTDSENPWDDDSVEVFVDFFNNREKEYNADDQRMVVKADGRISLSGQPEDGFHVATSRTEDGYIVEMTFRSHGRNRANRACGFDVAVNDDDDGGERDGQVVWQGTADNAKDTTDFGTIMLEPEPE